MRRARIGSKAIHAVRAAGAVAALLIVTAIAAAQRDSQSSDIDATAFVCPMHPDYTLDVAGSCPRCGMALVRAAPFDVRDYGLELTTRPIRGGRTAATPEPARPGERATWDMRVRRPGTGELVREFESVHDRRYHLFVISHDMEHFQHIHPEQRSDGVWTIDVTLPKAGHYLALSDFMPRGGSSQLLARPVVTDGFAGDLADDSARLTPDTNLVKVAGGLTARVSFDPPTFVAGLYGHLTFHLSDTGTGRPVTDLQTYLGAFGHTLIMSEDMVDYVHAHSLDILNAGDDDSEPKFLIPPGADLEKLRGGPEVTFDGLMPKPGRYRAWTQFRRHDTLHTLTTTFTVAAP